MGQAGQVPTTRRAVFGAAIALSAAASLPACAKASEPDAALVEIGKEYESILGEIHARLPIQSERCFRAREMIQAVPPAKQYEALRTAEIVCNVYEPALDTEPFYRRLDELHFRAEALRATTFEGMRAKTIIAAYWRNENEDEPGLDSLLEDMVAMFGIQLPYPVRDRSGAV